MLERNNNIILGQEYNPYLGYNPSSIQRGNVFGSRQIIDPPAYPFKVSVYNQLGELNGKLQFQFFDGREKKEVNSW